MFRDHRLFLFLISINIPGLFQTIFTKFHPVSVTIIFPAVPEAAGRYPEVIGKLAGRGYIDTKGINQTGHLESQSGGGDPSG